jgi:tetratricopeptide (TPR) repeat protein
MLFRRLTFITFFLALGAIPAAAQNVPNRHAVFSIGGSLRDESTKQTMGSILVTLEQNSGTPINSAFTREDGDFEFDGVGNGDYILEIDAKDYEQVRQTVTINGASRMGISIFLSRQVKSTVPPMQLSISAHQLSVPHKAHDEFEKGMSLIYLKSDYHGAITQFQLAIKDFPTYYEAYAEEGGAYYQLEAMGQAEEALRKSIELSSGQYADADFTLAAILSDTKRFEDAETAARKGISVDSSSWRGPFELARALTALKKIDEAEKTAEKSRDLMPDNPPVYLLLANIHIQKKDYPALKRDLDDYLRLAPTGPEADQARKTREHVQGILNASTGTPGATAQEKGQDDDDEPDAAAPQKASSPPVEPDNSGLPSLPPPTRVEP